ncbi:MAG: hypothetical protein K6F76_04585 [Clostridiales bacterium]|nr:hypothetical protein [Clostridiales bacterium]
MKNKTFFSFLSVLLLVFLFPTVAFANSSWQWISSTRPLNLLPIVIIVTLLIEIISVNYIAKVKSLKIVISVVSLANLASFLVPYIWLGISPYNVYSLYTPEEGLFYSINYTAQATPTFTVSLSYLLITLFVETPIVYLLLRKKVPNRKVLAAVIIAANILTTAITFAVERIFCHGEW